MAAEERLKYLIEAIWKGKSATVEARQDIKGVGTAADSGDGRIKSFNTTLGKISGIAAGAAGALKVFKTAFEFGEEGAALNKVAERFDALNASIGAVADDTLARLSRAVDGSVPKMELMAQANLLLSTGAASSADELVTMVGNIVKLKKPTEDAGSAIENFALLLANKSIPRLDTYGLSAGNVKKRYEELRKTVGDDEAFRTAVFEEMAISLEKVGEGADYTADAFTRARVKVEDATDSFKRFMADGLGPVVDAMAGGYGDQIDAIVDKQVAQAGSTEELIGIYKRLSQQAQENSGWNAALTGTQDDLRDAMRDVNREIARSVDSFDEFMAAQRELGFHTENLSEASAAYWRSLYDGIKAEQIMAVAVQRTADEEARRLLYMRDTTAASEALNDVMDNLSNGLHDMYDGLMDINPMIDEQRAFMQSAAEAARAQAEATRELEYAIGEDFYSALTAANDETLTMEQYLFQSAAQAGLTAEQLVILAAATGDYTDEQIQAALETALWQAEIDRLVAAVQAGDMTVQQATQAIEKMKIEQEGAAEKSVVLAGNLAGVRKQAEDAATQVKTLSDNLKNVPSFIESHIGVVVDWINGGGSSPSGPGKPGDKPDSATSSINGWVGGGRAAAAAANTGTAAINIYVDASGNGSPAAAGAAAYDGAARAMREAGQRAAQMVRMR